MTATNHVMTGALIGAVITVPALALPLAFASHFVCDALPHFDYPAKLNKDSDLKYFSWLAGDMALAASILLSIWALQPANVILIVLCGVVAASPDLMWLYYQVYKKGKNQASWSRIAKFHGRIQKRQEVKYWPAELGWFVAVTYLLARAIQP